MFLLDGPYVSDFLLDTLERRRFGVIDTEYARTAAGGRALDFVPPAEAAHRLSDDGSRLYTPSENSIGWIARHLAETALPEKIALFKNKAEFRRRIRPLYPDFFFREVDVPTLLALKPGDLPLPCVVKPATGFFSLGVYPVADADDFERMQRRLRSDLQAAENLYPREVLDARTFLIEEHISGPEYAIDACYDAAGEPVVLGILEHLFASERDVSDRIYTTSAEIVRRNLEPFTALLGRIGRLTGVRNFPVHVEIRRRTDGALVPVEVNPMRFGGWCTTPDLGRHAWGLNLYECYMDDVRPDWGALTERAGDAACSLVVLDNSTGVPGAEIAGFDYDALLGRFSRPLELRKTDFARHPLFGFLFVETTPETGGEIRNILNDDLKGYLLPPGR
jgi:hypothetical protein